MVVKVDHKSTTTPLRIHLAWALILVTLVYRIVAAQSDSLPNTSPTMALCFGGGLLLGRKFWWVPAILIVMSDFLIGLSKGGLEGIGYYTVLTASLFCLTAWLGSVVEKRSLLKSKTWPILWCGVLFSSVLFYVVTNTFCWAAYPGYAKTLAGWWQSQSTGLPGFLPSWCFLRNALIADSLWCTLAGLLLNIHHLASPARRLAVGSR